MVDEDASGLAVAVRGLGLRGPRGWVFRDIGLDAAPGALIAPAGPSGSGRTCLLLALTGRMRPTEGTATVGGWTLPRQMAALRRVSALAHVPGVTDLDPALTVAEHLRERELLQRRFGASVGALLRPRSGRVTEARRRTEAALDAAGLDLAALPKGPRTAVRDLERTEALRLSVALALTGRPRLLGVDDTDLKLSAAEREEVWSLLRSLAASGTTVVAVCAEAPEDAVTVSTRPERDAEAPEGPAEREGRPEREAEPAQDPPGPATSPAPAPAPALHDEPRHPHPHPHPHHDKETADALAEAGRD